MQLQGLQAKPGETNARLRSSDRLWGKVSVRRSGESERALTERQVWDYCANTRCYFFVVTTYEQWAFGRFSDGKCDCWRYGGVLMESGSQAGPPRL